MRRINTANTIDLSPGKKGFRGKNTAAGVPGTPLHEDWLNDLQEEIANAIEGSGLPLAAARDQLLQVLRRQMDFVTVVSVTAAVPGAPADGDRHLVAAGAAGAWAGQAGKLAIWNGSAWSFVTLPIGARIIDRATPVTSPNRELRQLGALAWSAVEATKTNYGHAIMATIAEAVTGLDDAKGVTPAGLQAARLSLSRVRFTTPGAISWSVPAGINRIRVKGWGSGGGGGWGTPGSPAGAAAGGGAGGYFEQVFAVVPGQTISGVVGTGGAAGISGANGGTGTATTVTAGAVTMGASGGAGGANAAAGAGSNSVTGGTTFGTPEIGLPGQASRASLYGGGFWYGGQGGDAPAGGGYGGLAGTGPANHGLAPGGGGGGSGAGFTAGAGARGEIWIEY